jgi:hypothetical protein
VVLPARRILAPDDAAPLPGPTGEGERRLMSLTG